MLGSIRKISTEKMKKQYGNSKAPGISRQKRNSKMKKKVHGLLKIDEHNIQTKFIKINSLNATYGIKS